MSVLGARQTKEACLDRNNSNTNQHFQDGKLQNSTKDQNYFLNVSMMQNTFFKNSPSEGGESESESLSRDSQLAM